MKIILTGGAGYIGSHTCNLLSSKGYETVIIDNFSTSREACLQRLNKICELKPKFYYADCRDKEAVKDIFLKERADAVIHFAGYKAVGDSVKSPVDYYENNVGSTINVLNAMKAAKTNVIVFSSSATVYALTDNMPLTEEHVLKPYNPYGWTKFMSERVIEDVCDASNELSAVNLRYFNPIGALESGLLGEDTRDVPNNLMPYITKVAIGKIDKLNVFGNDYDTIDGTGVRDYIHISDLAEGHAAALEYAILRRGCESFNLGTGRGTSVLELIHAFEKANGIKIPYEFTHRREGDIALYYADPSKAEKILGWKACRNIDDMCRDAWNWQSKNPNGYV